MCLLANDYLPLAPQIFLLSATMLTLIIGLFCGRQQDRVSYYLAQLSLLGTLGLLVQQSSLPAQLCLHNLFVHDSITSVASLLSVVLSLFAFSYGRTFLNTHPGMALDFYLMALFSVLGMLVMISSHHLIPLYLGLELLSLPLYVLVAIRQNGTTAEAAVKYFAMGALASAFLLYGFSLIYGWCGHLELTAISQSLAHIDQQHSALGVLAIIFIIAGLAFKMSAAPFHSWAPDVYQGAPAAITLFIGSVPKIAALVIILRLFADGFADFFHQWRDLWILIAVVSMGLGNIAAIAQVHLRRLLAYSAIAHMGYMLLGLIAGTKVGYSAALFYIISYGIMTLSAFGCLLALSNEGFEVETLSDLRGLNWRSPWLAFMMLIVMFSMAGIPPSVGFFAKMGVLEAIMGVHQTWLAVLALIFAIVGVFYYLRVVKSMYFENQEDHVPILTSLRLKVITSINTLVILWLGIFPTQLIDYCRSAFSL